jgi:hypothetical protein
MNEFFKNMAEFECLGSMVTNKIGFRNKLRVD